MKYSDLCEIYEALEAHSSRLEKTEILSEFLKKLKHEKNKEIVYLLQGRIFPDYDEREIGISTQLVIKALSKSTGNSDHEIEKLWKKLGDLGLVAEQIVGKKKQSTLFSHNLTTQKVLENLQKLPTLEGKGTVDKKMALIAELLTSASPKEAKYIVRTLLSDLRIGTGAGTIRDAIVWACFEKENKEAYVAVQEAYDKATDWKLVFEQACKGVSELEKTDLEPGKPVKVMLYPKVSSVEEAFERAGKPSAFEFKYDGFRMMINKEENGKIKLFTRRLDNVSLQFPDIIKYVKEHINGKSFIVDSEAVGYDPKTKKYRPFQEISQRIKRKYDIERLEKELPVELILFDIIYYEGKSYIKIPFRERRKLLEKITKKERHKVILAEQIVTDKEKEAKEFFEKAMEEGQEGLMVKNLDAPYKPGSRIGYGYKWKPEDRDFDLVITEAEYGTGKRAGWLTSYTVVCRDEGKFLEVGKVSTGLKEKEEGLSFKEMTKLLKPLIEKEDGRTVKVRPKIVVAVTYQNIQKSPTYASGYALRFPRITRFRPDRNTSDIASLKEIEKEYEKSG
jgi:DNA ligase-1